MSPSDDSAFMDVCSEEQKLGTEKHEAIQILVYPPKNKKFLVDEETNSIKIEPLVADSDGYVDKEFICSEKQAPLDGFVPSNNSVNFVNVSSLHQSTNDIRSCDDRLDADEFVSNDNDVSVKEILKLEKCFNNKCFLKGCKWSPDGFCLLSNSEDNVLRLFEIPESSTIVDNLDISPVLSAKEGGTIYDYEWYPRMNSSDPISCVFASTSQNAPIHLWDAFTGYLRATYQPIDQYDEVTAAYSLAFSPDGNSLYCGFKKAIRVFDIAMPGRISDKRNLKNKENDIYQSNIISSISVNPINPKIYALGSYDRTIGIYTEPNGELQCLLHGHKGGVTQILFSKDGIRLYSGARKDPEILCWDLRNPGKICMIFNRVVSTNQRIYFDLSQDGTYLITGSTDHRIFIYHTKNPKSMDGTSQQPLYVWKAHGDCVNSVHFHPFHPLLSSASGQYHATNLLDCEEQNNLKKSNAVENSIKIWSMNFKGNGF